MASIKRGTTPTLLVQINGITPEDVNKIEFLFKHQPREFGKEICVKAYPGDDVTFDAESSCFCIALTEAETRAFFAGNTAYMDTRITLTDWSIPATEIAAFGVSETLFKGDSL